jgi:energy-coupling factor transporter ATP-binding protein EcfA2
MKAYVFGEIRPSRVQAVLEEYSEGEPVLGMTVQIKNNDKLVIGRVVNCSRSSDIVKEYIQAKKISQDKDSPSTQELLKRVEGTILEIELITAFQDNKRVPLNFLLQPLSEVHYIEDIPIPESPHKGYLGYLWGTHNKYPLILQDFQTMKEAYHFFIAGQPGSGKSTLTQMILALYNKINPKMNFLILDTVGEFTASFKGEKDMFLPLKDVWQGNVEIYTPPETLALEGWDLFKEICLDYDVMHTIGVPVKSTDNVKWGIDAIMDILIGSIAKNTNHTSTRYMSPKLVEETFRQLVNDEEKLDKNFVKKVYKGKEAQGSLKETMKDPRTFKKFVNKLKEIAELFYTGGNKKTISDVIKDFSTSVVNGHPGRCVVLNFTLHISHDRSNSLRVKYVRETLRSLYSTGVDIYNNRGDINLNTLVILEEAHNYAPKYTDIDGQRTLSNEIVKYYIETRKFGIGWACITTRPSNVRREIFEHSRVKIIGMGLSNGGPDTDLLRESFGPEFLDIYRLLPDPSDPLSSKKEVCFAIHGPITTLSRQKPEFITVFNSKEEFLKINGFQV